MNDNVAVVRFLFVNPVYCFSCELMKAMKCNNDGLLKAQLLLKKGE